MKKRNEDFRQAKGKIPNWMIAERLGCHENTLYRLLRQELSPEKKAELFKIIEELKEEH